VEELIPHYGADCPVAVCYRSSWPDQDKVTGTLADIAEKVEAKGFKLTALILVGHVLDTTNFEDSYLYKNDKPNIFRRRKNTLSIEELEVNNDNK
jgi:precorrin-4/cobalt-precorrin-4 C11-methyltransferase